MAGRARRFAGAGAGHRGGRDGASRLRQSADRRRMPAGARFLGHPAAAGRNGKAHAPLGFGGAARRRGRHRSRD